MFKGIISADVCNPIVVASTNFTAYFSKCCSYSQYSKTFILSPWGKGQLMRKQVRLAIKGAFRDCSILSRVSTTMLLKLHSVWCFWMVLNCIWNKRIFWIDLFLTCLHENYISPYTPLCGKVLFIMETYLVY